MQKGKHETPAPSARKVRRTCSNELYRAAKRLNKWIPPERMAEAERLYFRKVMLNLPFIAENSSNRKKLCDWWDEHAAPEIAQLWGVDVKDLSRAFRDAFGG